MLPRDSADLKAAKSRRVDKDRHPTRRMSSFLLVPSPRSSLVGGKSSGHKDQRGVEGRQLGVGDRQRGVGRRLLERLHLRTPSPALTQVPDEVNNNNNNNRRSSNSNHHNNTTNHDRDSNNSSSIVRSLPLPLVETDKLLPPPPTTAPGQGLAQVQGLARGQGREVYRREDKAK